MNSAYIKLDGTPVDDALLADVTVTQALNAHWWCHIDLRQTEDNRFSAEEMLGKDLRIATYDEDGAEQVIFAGLIVESELEFEIFGSYTGRIAAVSKSYLLDLTRRRNYFSQKTGQAVANTLISGVGLALEGTMKAGSSRDFFQLEETDFQFLLRLVDDSEAWLRPTESGIEVQSAFQKSVTLNWRAEGGLVQFKVKGRLSQPSSDGAQYDPVAMESQTFEDISDTAEFSGAAARMVSAVVNQSQSLLPSTYIGQRSRAVTVTAYQDLLKKESRRSVGRSVTCSGESREPLLRAGGQVKINGALDAQGTYGITRVVHHWDSAGYTNQFECTPWTKYTNPEAPQLRRCHGIVPARVTENNDPDNRGRVRVQFYWQEDSETTWLPMMAPHAGADRGFMFLPEVGDEVWVAFEEGDPERGRVLGCAWNGVQKPPREEFWGGDVAPNDVKRIVTKSGHRISIVDKDGKSSIVLATPKHVKVSLIENSNETGDSMLALHSDGDIFLSAPNGRIHFHSKYFSREVGGGSALQNSSSSPRVAVTSSHKFQSLAAHEISIQKMATTSTGKPSHGAPLSTFCAECKNCQTVADENIAWAKKMQGEYRRAGSDPANKTLSDVNDAVEASLAAQGIPTEVGGTTDDSGNITVKKQKGPCARLEEKGTLLHEEVHSKHTRDLERKYGKGTPELKKHWNDAKDDADDEVNAYQAQVNFWTQFKKECKARCP